MSGFMTLEVWQEMGAEFDVPYEGLQFLPLTVGMANDYTRQGPRENAWWAQYSAPGYMDQTEMVHGTTPSEAAKACFELYGDWESPEERAELASVLWQCRKLERKGA